ncbi:MAG TPA: hypothetical protein VK828_15635 [Terriglobales bacterium]|jgi:predicted nucleic acid-binding protein|nr:hypothetical protein [Terriglobales bacterium]
MEIRYLLDTNVASFVIKGNSTAVDRRLVRVPMAQLAISAVTEGELRFGAARMPHATRLHNMIEDFFLRVAILPGIQTQRNNMDSSEPRWNARASAWGTLMP